MNDRAGTPATADDLVDLDALLAAYHERVPDVSIPEQKVVFGTSGHRGSSLDTAFNDTHIAAITQAIVEYRTEQGTTGPLFIGRDTHALSAPAEQTALQVLAANGVRVLADAEDGFVPTPALSHAIIKYNREEHGDTADGIVITPSHNPPRDGGFKYNPPHGGPADSDATSWIADRANAIIADGNADVRRQDETAAEGYDFLGSYVSDLEHIIDIEAIKRAGVRIGADPLGGASLPYWERIRDHYGLDLTVVNPEVDPTWAFMTLDWDGKIRMDPSSPSAMASVLAHKDDFDVLTGNDADSDRHGIVTPDGGLMNPNHYLAVAIEYLYAHRPDWRDDAAIGKTLVSSSIIDRVAGSLGRRLWEVPVGFKWFVPGLIDGSVAFGGEESAGASFLRKDGTRGRPTRTASSWRSWRRRSPPSPARPRRSCTPSSPSASATRSTSGSTPRRARSRRPACRSSTATRSPPTPLPATRSRRSSRRPRATTRPSAASRSSRTRPGSPPPSGTEDVYKIYAESFVGQEHLEQVQREAKEIVDAALGA